MQRGCEDRGIATSGVGSFCSTIAEGCTIGDPTVDGTFLESSRIDWTGGPSSRDVRFTDYRVAGAGIGTRASIGSGEVSPREPAAQDGGEYVPVRWIARDIVVADGEVAYSAASQVTSFPETISPDPAVTFGLEVTVEPVRSVVPPGRRPDTQWRYGAMLLEG